MSRSIWLLILLVSLALLVPFTACTSGGGDDDDSGDGLPNYVADDEVGDDTGDDDAGDDDTGNDDTGDDSIVSDDSGDDSAFKVPTPSDAIGVFVAKRGDDSNPGTIALPKLTITAGIALAETESKFVFVAAGNYNESLTSSVSLYGGYESVGWTRNMARYVTNVTAGAAINGISTALTLSGSNSLAIQGFTIYGGSGNGSCGVHNGVFSLFGTSTSVLSNNIIYGGSGISSSAGLRNDGQLTLVNNIINGGSGDTNFAVANNGTAVLVNNTIKGGSGFDSYGVGNNPGTVKLFNNAIDGGSGSRSVGILIFPSIGFPPIAPDIPAWATLVNNEIWGSAQSCMIYDSMVWDIPFFCRNYLFQVNACIWDGCVAASGNISADPLFVDPANGDFHLQPGSPCIDTGINPIPDYLDSSFADLVDFDFDGDARPYGPGWDIGADEWRP